MRKILAVLITLAMTTALLTGCTGIPVAVETPGTQEAVKEEAAETVSGDAVKTGLYVSANISAENATAEADGNTTTDISIIAVTVSDSGVIEACEIDAIQGKVPFDAEGQLASEMGEVLSKKELGENYGMKAFSPIGKEWDEQVEAIEAYAVGKTVEELKTGAIDETGVVKDADLASSATIYLGSFIWGIESAVNNASYLGAVSGDELVITSIATSDGSKAATAEEAGCAQVDVNVAVVTKNGDVITSCIIDSVQAKMNFNATGIIDGEESSEVLSKNQLGENYGLKTYSPIGKEWNEQVAAFADYVKGKTTEEVLGMALTETTAPAEADLTSSVTIAVGDFMALIEKMEK